MVHFYHWLQNRFFQDDSLEEFFAPNRPEHFFVKNLETIQGDERDVIFMSVGHGRASPGDKVGGSIVTGRSTP